jgi:uncharacterized protein
MAKEGQTPAGEVAHENEAAHGVTIGLDVIAAAAKSSASKGPPPVHMWNPPYCGEIDLRIASDGTWFYEKTPIGRPALVRLFASVLKREADRYYLVTPVEKCGIVVEDAPFLAVELHVERAGEGDLRANGQIEGQVLRFRTNVDEWVTCGAEHALRLERDARTEGLKPYVHVRRDLWAKVTRTLYYDLVNLGEERDVAGLRMFGVSSQGQFFPMVPANTLKEIF